MANIELSAYGKEQLRQAFFEALNNVAVTPDEQAPQFDWWEWFNGLPVSDKTANATDALRVVLKELLLVHEATLKGELL